MPYYIDAEKISLDALQKRIEESDLVPSRMALLENISDVFSRLKAEGYHSFEDLKMALKNSKRIPMVSEKTGIRSEYLVLLRRELESYFPKILPIRAFDWINEAYIEDLEKMGLKNTLLLFETINSLEKRSKIALDLGVDIQVIEELFSYVDLTRIQWVSPLAARMLFTAGYKDSGSVAKADAEEMCRKLDEINSKHHFFKGKIGLRDVKRLIHSASYLL